MSRSHLSRIAALAALMVGAGVPAIVAAAPASAAATTYKITDLGSLGGGTTYGLEINASGQRTGDSFLAKQVQVPCPYPQSANQRCLANLDHAFFWSNGTMTDLGTLGGLDSQGVAINDSGEVVGFSETKTGASGGPFLSTALGHKLIALSGMSQALGINDSGQIAGECNELPANPEVFACVVSDDGTITQLGDSVPPLGNDIACGEAVAIRARPSPIALPRARAPVPWGSRGGVDQWHPHLLGTPSTYVTGTALNDHGRVVGITQTSTGAEDGFLWSDGTVQNLNTLIPAGSGYQIESATGINDNGQIVANAENTATGQTHALLLTPS